MIKRPRLLVVCVLFLGVLLALAADIYAKTADNRKAHTVYDDPLPPAEAETAPCAGIGADYTVTADFSTHLPLVVLEMEEEPPVQIYFDQAQQKYLPIEGIVPYVAGRVSIMDGERNSIADTPALTSLISIKRRGNSSMVYDKPQYLIKLVDESGMDAPLDVLGMGADEEWVLNGSMSDKSMMRNYLAYRVIDDIMPFTPENVYCEVVLKMGGRYEYRGVYLLGESVKKGKSRVDLHGYNPDDAFNSYLVRRDRFDEDAVTLDTWATREGLCYGSLALRYPPKAQVQYKMIDYVEQDLSRVEHVLYSDSQQEFMRYPDYIDVDSFVDYFLVNEFFGNYDAGNNSTYMYKDEGEKLHIGPVWDYDGDLDNYALEAMDPTVLAFQVKPWFEKLCMDESFIDKLEARYAELRRNELSETRVLALVETIRNYLGPAQQREWTRWKTQYEDGSLYDLQDTVDPLTGEVTAHRRTDAYEQELYRIRVMLRRHGYSIPSKLMELHKLCLYRTDITGHPGVLLLLCAIAFALPLLWIRRIG